MTCKVKEDEILESKYTILLSVQKKHKHYVKLCWKYKVLLFIFSYSWSMMEHDGDVEVSESHQKGNGDGAEETPFPSS